LLQLVEVVDYNGSDAEYVKEFPNGSDAEYEIHPRLIAIM
jgi:hypothetical protein